MPPWSWRIKWLLLCVITLGIYSFWVGPRIQKWIVENTDFDPAFTPGPQFTAAANQPDAVALL